MANTYSTTRVASTAYTRTSVAAAAMTYDATAQYRDRASDKS